jgi:hypothetical protein
MLGEMCGERKSPGVQCLFIRISDPGIHLAWTRPSAYIASCRLSIARGPTKSDVKCRVCGMDRRLRPDVASRQ